MGQIDKPTRGTSHREDQASPAAEIQDFSDLIIARQWAFQQLSALTGEPWGWSHPRVKDWMNRIGANNPYDIPYGRYAYFVNQLMALIEQLQLNQKKN